ncbi:MAG: hypothetical protein Sylvanvirus1_50 [Sylvanvirus sp.]|uniref:Uncharacterized protein n=1 Tax=Sylvanvirus sp. TaxID=2487774 RepID=A0A3G5AIM6_9VIRU|nr:MAG: hypothetical protein Sylvanvirus1_50 [Sylvanvirus sp.]
MSSIPNPTPLFPWYYNNPVPHSSWSEWFFVPCHIALLHSIFNGFTCILGVIDVLSDILVLQQFYEDGEQVYFYISIAILACSWVAYPTVFMFQYYRGIQHSYNHLACFLMLLCISPALPFLSVLMEEQYPWTLDFFGPWNLIHIHISNRESNSSNLEDQNIHGTVKSFLKRSCFYQSGFIVESVMEAIPQSVLLTIYLVIHEGQYTSLHLFSLIISMLTVMSKGFIVAYSIDTRVCILSFLTVIVDLFGLYSTMAFLFYSTPSMSLYSIPFIDQQLPSYPLCSILWIWKETILLGSVAILGILWILHSCFYFNRNHILFYIGWMLVFVCLSIPAFFLLEGCRWTLILFLTYGDVRNSNFNKKLYTFLHGQEVSNRLGFYSQMDWSLSTNSSNSRKRSETITSSPLGLSPSKARTLTMATRHSRLQLCKKYIEDVLLSPLLSHPPLHLDPVMWLEEFSWYHFEEQRVHSAACSCNCSLSRTLNERSVTCPINLSDIDFDLDDYLLDQQLGPIGDTSRFTEYEYRALILHSTFSSLSIKSKLAISNPLPLNVTPINGNQHIWEFLCRCCNVWKHQFFYICSLRFELINWTNKSQLHYVILSSLRLWYLYIVLPVYILSSTLSLLYPFAACVYALVTSYSDAITGNGLHPFTLFCFYGLSTIISFCLLPSLFTLLHLLDRFEYCSSVYDGIIIESFVSTGTYSDSFIFNPLKDLLYNRYYNFTLKRYVYHVLTTSLSTTLKNPILEPMDSVFVDLLSTQSAESAIYPVCSIQLPSILADIVIQYIPYTDVIEIYQAYDTDSSFKLYKGLVSNSGIRYRQIFRSLTALRDAPAYKFIQSTDIKQNETFYVPCVSLRTGYDITDVAVMAHNMWHTLIETVCIEIKDLFIDFEMVLTGNRVNDEKLLSNSLYEIEYVDVSSSMNKINDFQENESMSNDLNESKSIEEPTITTKKFKAPIHFRRVHVVPHYRKIFHDLFEERFKCSIDLFRESLRGCTIEFDLQNQNVVHFQTR